MSKPERPVVCVIGPVQPYRGGIAQYTESLRAAFDPVADVHTFSFEKQYPAMLYPGETDVIPGAERLADVRYTISATNPISWRRTVREIAALKPDLVLINWWTLYWQPWTALMSSWLRRRGITVVFLCHNIGDHGSGGLRKRLGAAMLRRADGYVVHSSMLAHEVNERVPGKPVLTRPLPVFDNFPEARENWQPRGRLDLLFFGFIRPYKGLDVLLDAYQELADPDVALSVIGESWEDARPCTRGRSARHRDADRVRQRRRGCGVLRACRRRRASLPVGRRQRGHRDGLPSRQAGDRDPCRRNS